MRAPPPPCLKAKVIDQLACHTNAVVGEYRKLIEVFVVDEHDDAQACLEKRLLVGVNDNVGKDEELKLRLEQFPLDYF